MSQVDQAWVDQLKWDGDGLIPAVIQDVKTKRVLTVAYMNQTSFLKTIETRETWFYSRSRQALWHKGETSGNTQRVVGIEIDCDGDTLLIQVEPSGPACHTGANSCFDGEPIIQYEDSHANFEGILSRLEKRVQEREKERPEGAYTTYLFEKGLDKILN